MASVENVEISSVVWFDLFMRRPLGRYLAEYLAGPRESVGTKIKRPVSFGDRFLSFSCMRANQACMSCEIG